MKMLLTAVSVFPKTSAVRLEEVVPGFNSIEVNPAENPVDSVPATPFRAQTRKLPLAIAVLLSGIVAPAAFAQSYGAPGYGYGPPPGYAYAPPGYGYGPLGGYGQRPGAQGPGTAAAPQHAPQAVQAAGVTTQHGPQAAEAPTQQGAAQARDDRGTAPATLQRTAQGEKAAGVEQPVRQTVKGPQGGAQPSQGGGEGATLRTTVSVDVPEPVVTVNQADSIVQVQQGQAQVAVDPGRPQVTVNQSAPQVRVSMPQPKITIDMPPPDILMEMPNPTVSVNVPQPRVSVTQAPPTVTVEQGKPEVQVGSDASKGTGQPDVRVEKGQQQVTMSDAQQATVNIAEAQPQVRYNAAQPEVRITSEGEPQVQFNQSGEPRIQIRQLSADETLQMAKQQGAKVQGQTAAQSKQIAQPAAVSEKARE